MSFRVQNERRFESWTVRTGGGRIYQRQVVGRNGWRAIYFKEVNEDEKTVRFWQEIFDSCGNLQEVHEKFPVDTGHRKA